MRLNKSRTYVLVHGAWTGGWIWRFVATRLSRRGHVVYTPTLTGLGERRHLARPDTNLETHIRDIVAVLECEDVRNVILVGWSYGGIVIGGAASRAADRIGHLVFLDATYAKGGQSAYDVWGCEVQERDEQRARRYGTKWLAVPPSAESFRKWIPDESLWKYVTLKMTPQPIETFRQVLKVPNPEAFANIPHTHILSLSHKTDQSIAAYKERVAKEPGFAGCRLLDTDHFAIITDPQIIAKELLRCKSRKW